MARTVVFRRGLESRGLGLQGFRLWPERSWRRLKLHVMQGVLLFTSLSCVILGSLKPRRLLQSPNLNAQLLYANNWTEVS